MKIDFRICLVTDRRQAAGGDILGAIAAALDGGIRAVQLREKDLGGRALFVLAERARRLTAGYGARLLVNGRPDVAAAVGADGVHLGGDAIPAADARRLLGPEAIVGCSAHDLRELRGAEEGGADYATFGPVYATPSKAAYGPPAGIASLAEACRSSRVPVFALGGVGPENVDELVGAGAYGIALISRVVSAADPRAAAAELTARLARTRAKGPETGHPIEGR